MPAGFADGTDDVGDDWNALTNVPAGFADDTDDIRGTALALRQAGLGHRHPDVATVLGGLGPPSPDHPQLAYALDPLARAARDGERWDVSEAGQHAQGSIRFRPSPSKWRELRVAKVAL